MILGLNNFLSNAGCFLNGFKMVSLLADFVWLAGCRATPSCTSINNFDKLHFSYSCKLAIKKKTQEKRNKIVTHFLSLRTFFYYEEVIRPQHTYLPTKDE